MKLKTAVFYQSVKGWDKSESNTYRACEGQTIDLEDHLVKVSKEGSEDVIIVPTANLRFAVAEYSEAFALNAPAIPEGSNKSETPTSSEFVKATKEAVTKGKKAIAKELEKEAHAKQ